MISLINDATVNHPFQMKSIMLILQQYSGAEQESVCVLERGCFYPLVYLNDLMCLHVLL